ncbi:bifunctional ornithine acetyltransferase/N-acetylglutamate synthase [Metabacillus arenae]|uniref:Arginine biosynthesis bifunctional protein ArgJ n=1 Tax=Metabacillus arenae TaxID=2771434 RepID=A0A926S0M5_9BACI|nr:bifunctional ornithine acetyltransferase/N-acetylglutamate synthase [Metabacillus arenae]MBD1383447.1 bifunctional ornithine acetyltransferase/N-acetylglutamate synthase [Metabacillus arenae]
MALLQMEESLVNKIENGTVITPKGFKADGIHIGLRHSKKDLGIIFSEVPANSAAVYTQSHFQAAPLLVTQQSIAKEGKLQAVVVNSAIANACTGEKGLEDANEMRKLCANKFSLSEHYVAVASTGVIGEYLNMDLISKGIQELKPGAETASADSFEQAILTTDLVQKNACVQVEIDGKTVTIGGASKGSGMIHPNMATMLGFVTTDAAIDTASLHEALREVTNQSFNQITVDGETSTNDMVLVMANGLAENQPLNSSHPQWDTFKFALKLVSEELAKQIAKDGEGATRLIEVNVCGAESEKDARVISKKIVGSNLVKTAVYGADANWGRIIGAIGHSDAAVDPSKVSVYLKDICLFKEGTPQSFSEEDATKYLQNKTVVFDIFLNIGEGNGTAWGCDLTYDYVKINASYRT